MQGAEEAAGAGWSDWRAAAAEGWEKPLRARCQPATHQVAAQEQALAVQGSQAGGLQDGVQGRGLGLFECPGAPAAIAMPYLLTSGCHGGRCPAEALK